MPHETTDRKQAGCRACARHGDAVRRRFHDPGAGNGVARRRQDEALRTEDFAFAAECEAVRRDDYIVVTLDDGTVIVISSDGSVTQL